MHLVSRNDSNNDKKDVISESAEEKKGREKFKNRKKNERKMVEVNRKMTSYINEKIGYESQYDD